MKAFRFRLERVLSWRGTELALAEAKVEQLMSGLRSTTEPSVVIARDTAGKIDLGPALEQGLRRLLAPRRAEAHPPCHAPHAFL